MSTISAAEANRQFSSLLRQVSQGESVTVLSHGRPVAVISPAVDRASDADRSGAKARLLERLGRQSTLGARDWSRDELYERGR